MLGRPCAEPTRTYSPAAPGRWHSGRSSRSAPGQRVSRGITTLPWKRSRGWGTTCGPPTNVRSVRPANRSRIYLTEFIGEQQGGAGWGLVVTAATLDRCISVKRWWLPLCLVLACCGPAATLSPTASPTAVKSPTPTGTRGTWSSAGTMKTARDYHTATLLRNGKVLVAGGYSGPLGTVVLASTELYDPSTNGWSDAAPMLTPHASHTAALLPDGKVLIASGRSSEGDTMEAETYDPATNVWSKAGNLAVARTSATAVVLASGKVLVIGGNGTTNPGAELYDPGTNSWLQLPTSATHHVVVVGPMGDGTVLVLGDLSKWRYQFFAQYDPMSNTWHPIGRPPISFASAVLLRNGKVLFVRKWEPGDDDKLAS